MKPPKAKRVSTLAPSLESAAAQIGCAKSDLTRAKASGSKAFKPNGSVSIPEVTQWLKDNPPSGESTSKAVLECRRLIAQCEKLEHDLAKARREVIPRDEYITNNARAVAEFWGALRSLEGNAPTWSGLPGHEIQQRVKALIRETMGTLQGRFESLATE